MDMDMDRGVNRVKSCQGPVLFISIPSSFPATMCNGQQLRTHADTSFQIMQLVIR